MTARPKIALSASRDIPFDKLVLSDANVRRIKAGVSIEELAEDIGRRTLLQSLTVRPIVDADGVATGMYEIPAGGRRYRALDLLVRQKRLSKTAPIPCVIHEGGIAEEDSLAENIQRAPLHPLDQFRAFLALREKGRSEEEIAAAFFVSVAVVRQRLRLASVSPRLLDVYAEDGLTLEQLMAFSVNGDHERQEQVFDQLQHAYSREPYAIRRMLTEGAVRASDKRAQFIGEAYEAIGGAVMRDLFQGDDGGWMTDVALVDRLVAERLEREADAVRAEGWKWIEVARDHPYGHTHGLRQLRGDVVPLSAEEEAARDALRGEMEAMEVTYAQVEELPEEVDRRLSELETALAAFEQRPIVFESGDISRAGAFISIDAGGELRIERGFVRPEDELPIVEDSEVEPAMTEPDGVMGEGGDGALSGNEPASTEPEEDEGLRPLSDRLVTELTVHRTVALRDAISRRPDVAFLATLHVLCLKAFYRYATDSCLQIDLRPTVFDNLAPGINDTVAAKALDHDRDVWVSLLPGNPADLWATLVGWDDEARQALFAHCVAFGLNAVHEAWSRRPTALAHGDRLAEALDLDMVAAGWTPTVDSYLGRVTKARILEAVREARGDQAADNIASLKKDAMAQAAQDLLAGSGWLPEPLRTPGRASLVVTDEAPEAGDSEAVAQSEAVEGEPAVEDEAAPGEDEPAPFTPVAFAAE